MLSVKKLKSFALALVTVQVAGFLFLSPLASAATYSKSGGCSSGPQSWTAKVTFEAVDRDTSRPVTLVWSHNPVWSASITVKEQVGSSVKKTWTQSAAAGSVNKTLQLTGSVNGNKADMNVWVAFQQLTFACSTFIHA